MNKLMTIVAAVGLLTAIPGVSLGAGAAATVNGTVNAAAGTAGAAGTADATTKAGASTDATKASASTNTAASASLTATSTYSDVAGSLSAAGNANLDLTAVTSTSDIQIVKVSSLAGYKAGASASMSATETAAMHDLDAKVAANAAISAKLKAAGYSASDVVAVSTSASGSVTVFVNK